MLFSIPALGVKATQVFTLKITGGKKHLFKTTSPIGHPTHHFEKILGTSADSDFHKIKQ